MGAGGGAGAVEYQRARPQQHQRPPHSMGAGGGAGAVEHQRARSQQHKRPPPHSETQPIRGAPMPHGNHFSDGNSHPPLTPQPLEMITAATIAVLNQHLASIGLLPRIAATPSGDPISGTDPLPPAPRDTPPTPPRTLPVLPRLAPLTPASVLSSAYLTSIEIHHLHDDRSPASSSSHAQHRFYPAFRIPDARYAPRPESATITILRPHRQDCSYTAPCSINARCLLSGIFDVADPSGSVTMRSPTWVLGWHAPLLKLTKASIVPNHDDTHTLHRLVDDLFAQLQERLASGVDGPAAFRTLLTDVAGFFDRARRGAALETLQTFDVPSGTPFSSFLHSFRVIVVSTVHKGGPLASSLDMAMELIRIRTAQQYPMLMPTLFPGNLVTQEKPYDSLATLWNVFAHLRHNTSPAKDGDAFEPAPQGLSFLTHHLATSSGASVTSPHRNTRRMGHQDAAHGILNVLLPHSRRDPFSIDYDLWPFDDRDYDIFCTVTNNGVNTDLSLSTPLLSEDARRQACVQ